MKKTIKLSLLSLVTVAMTACGGTNGDSTQSTFPSESDPSEPISEPISEASEPEAVITVKGASEELEYGHLYDSSSITFEIDKGGVKSTLQNDELEVNLETLDEWSLGEQSIQISDKDGKYEPQIVDVDVVPATHLKMLLIGNSYTEDTLSNIPNVLKGAEGLDLEISYLFIGGTSIDNHYQNLVNNSAAYSFRSYTTSTGKFYNVENYKMKDALLEKEWDLISLQQQSMNSSKAESFGNLDKFVEKIQGVYKENERECPRFVWHLTWSYPEFSTNEDFKNLYNREPKRMYEANINVLHNVILQKPYFVNYCPVGTAVQNIRTSYLTDDDVFRDELHLSLKEGRYLASCTFLSTYLGQDACEYLASQPILTNEEMLLIEEAVDNALAKKDECTQSQYVFPPSDDLLQLKNNAIAYLYGLLKKDSSRTYSEAFVTKTKQLIEPNIISIRNATTEAEINKIIISTKSKIEEYQQEAKANEVKAAKDFFATRQDVTSEGNFSCDDNGRIIQSDTQGWTRIRFGEQSNNNFTVFEFDLTPTYLNGDYSSMTIRFREWDTSTNLNATLMAQHFTFKRNVWSNEAGTSVEDTTYHDDFNYYKVASNQTRHFRIMCSGWLKTFMIDDDVVASVTMETDCVGYFSIESWQTEYVLENPVLTKYATQDKLVADYPQVFYPKNVVEQKEHEHRDELSAVLAGKKFSMLGDSISTYEGISNDTTKNSTIGCNDPYYVPGFTLSGPNDTYWKLLEASTDMELLVNNSWSGSRATCLFAEDTYCGCSTRCENLHCDVGENAGTNPDLIFVYLGTNDLWADVVQLGSFNSIEDIFDGENYKDYINIFALSYAVMIDRIMKKYPNADVFCMTVMPNKSHPADSERLTGINDLIRKISMAFGAHLIDLALNCEVVPNLPLYTDPQGYVHPNIGGMECMATCIEDALESVYLN